MARLPNYDPAEHTLRLSDLALTRREALQRAGMGMGALSLSWLLGDSLLGATSGASKADARGPLANDYLFVLSVTVADRYKVVTRTAN